MENNLKVENEKLRKRVLELESHENSNTKKKCKKLKLRSLDFTKFKTRHIAIEICYLGWSYSGLVTQLNVENTVLEKFYQALEKCRLIENRDSANIVVCGRTDKGVSAFQQVISLRVRSNLTMGKGIVPESGSNILLRKDLNDQETDFILLLNKALPIDIRALKWSPVDLDFSARFSCRNRAYKYLFPKSNLSIQNMELGGKKLIGEHDFRNFCCMQVNQGVTNYTRTIFDFSIEPFDKDQKDDIYNIYVINIKASAFIYHQIRCIVAIILMIGQGFENVDIIDKLLDMDGLGGSGKPQYNMASDLPLVFYEAEYEDIEWQVSKEATRDYIADIERMWTTHKMKETILKLYLNEIESSNPHEVKRKPLANAISYDTKTKLRRSLVDRIKEPTLNERIESERIKSARKANE